MKIEAARGPADKPGGGREGSESAEEVKALQSLRNYFTRQPELGSDFRNPSPDDAILFFHWANVQFSLDRLDGKVAQDVFFDAVGASYLNEARNQYRALRKHGLVQLFNSVSFLLTEEGKRFVSAKNKLM